MEIQVVRSFVEIARVGSVSAAARNLGYSQPAVTAHLATLERQLQGPLFHRGRRGTTPTALGLRVLPHATQLLDHLEQLFAERAEEPGPASVCVGFWPQVLQPLLQQLVASSHRHLPHVLVRLLPLAGPGDMEHALLTGRIDVQLAPGPFIDPRLEVYPLLPLTVGLRMTADHPLAGIRRLRTQDILEWPSYRLGGVPRIWDAFWLACAMRGGDPQMSGRERHTLAECLEPMEGDTVILCPSRMLAVLPPSDTWLQVVDYPPVAIELAWRTHEDRPAVLALTRLWQLMSKGGSSTAMSRDHGGVSTTMAASDPVSSAKE